jgi:ABC-2 family transporter protein
MILLACLPALVLMAELDDMGGAKLLAAVALPASVAFGSGGVAVAASVMMRRGVAAMVAVYLLLIVVLLASTLAFWTLPTEVTKWVNLTNPFQSMFGLFMEDSVQSALITSAFWLTLGIAGAAVASWRLRPVCAELIGSESALDRRGSRGWVPPLNEEHPMLWKELFIERTGSLGRFGWVLGFLLFVWLVGTSTVFGAVAAWCTWVHPDPLMRDWAAGQMSEWIARPSVWVSILVQWTIGLRGAVAISSERERGSWDALLTSPLEGGEIVVGKLWGSLYSLRWLFGATFLAWTTAAFFGAMNWTEYANRLGTTFLVGAFLAAAGVRISLATQTATQAMAITIGVWLGAIAAMWAAALILVLMGMAVFFLLMTAAAQLGLISTDTVLTPPKISLWTVINVTDLALYLVATIVIVLEARLRFDRIAGRRAGGELAVKVDKLVHGEPLMHAPVTSSGRKEKAFAGVAEAEREGGTARQDESPCTPT